MATGWIKIPLSRTTRGGIVRQLQSLWKLGKKHLIATVMTDFYFFFEGVSKWTDLVQIYCMIQKNLVNIQYSLTGNRNVVFYMIAWKE